MEQAIQQPLSVFTHHCLTKTGVIGSFCPVCFVYIAYSDHPQALEIAERAHRCPKLARPFPPPGRSAA